MAISNSAKKVHTRGAKGADAEVFRSVQAEIPVVPNKMGTTVVM